MQRRRSSQGKTLTNDKKSELRFDAAKANLCKPQIRSQDFVGKPLNVFWMLFQEMQIPFFTWHGKQGFQSPVIMRIS